MNLERIGSITSELSANLLKSIVLPPGGLLGWITRNQRALFARDKQRSGRPELRQEHTLDVAQAAFPNGPVVLFGGYPAPDEAVVEAVHLAGGRSAHVAVIPVAAIVDPAASAAEAMRIFTRYGMKKMSIFELDSREKATSSEWCARLATFDAVVLCGESPAQGLQVLQATLASITLREMVQAGKLLVGIDGGAALVGSRLFPSAEVDQVSPGLSIIPGLLFDTDLTQAGRLGRLDRAMSQEDAALMLGVGIDAGSALVIQGSDAKVLGEGSVTFIDPRERGAEEGPKQHLLYDGYRMNLRLRRVTAPQPAASGAR